jgi:hypothetical protein
MKIRTVFTLLSLVSVSTSAQIIREGYDSTGDSFNPTESILTPSTVAGGTFGKLFSDPVQGSVYAMPLYVPNVTIASTLRTGVIYVADMEDVVYAFDANAAGSALWTNDFKVTENEVPVLSPTSNIDLTVGIESTPYIDLTTNTLYCVSFSVESNIYIYRLHALDITTGLEKFGGPVAIGGSVAGTGYGSVNGTLAFAPVLEQQRPGIVEDNGTVWIEFGSFGDQGNYHGWVFGYNAATLQQTFIWCDTANGQDGGIWSTGHAPEVDASGNVYLVTGNGDNAAGDYGDSILKFSSSGALLSYFTPADFLQLGEDDEDLGSGGLLLIPNTTLVAGGGKDGNIYVTNQTSLGGEWASNSQIVQQFSVGNSIYTSPAYDSQNNTLYVWPEGGSLSAYPFNGTAFASTSSQSTFTSPQNSFGGAIAITPGIVWVSAPSVADEDNGGTVPAALYAFSASNLATEFWNSNMSAARDSLGIWPKFRPPLAAGNGKIYVPSLPNGSVSGELNVYGLIQTSTPTGLASSVTFVSEDTTTQGAWSTHYGADGELFANSTQAPPSYATATLQGQSSWTWTTGTTDPRALNPPAGGIAAAWYSPASFTFDLNVNGMHQVAMYLLDWDDRARTETITIADAATGTVEYTTNVSSFSNGVYLVWNISGAVIITVKNTGYPNAVASGLFFGAGTSSSSNNNSGSSGSSVGGTAGGSSTPTVKLCATGTANCITVAPGSTITVSN